jgi:mRNA-degrading endonuclease RelE of RelBE toxin-antitoxin system
VDEFIGWNREALDFLLDLARKDWPQARLIFRGVYQSRFDAQSDIKKLAGRDERWRLRVGDWRVIFKRTAAGIQIIEVVNRRDAYR